MMKITIWQRYLYKKICMRYFFILFVSYALFILFDLMAHLKHLNHHTSLLKLAKYYLCIFSKRMHILLPFAILIGSIFSLLQFQVRNELVALLAGGIPRKKLMRPFLVVS